MTPSHTPDSTAPWFAADDEPDHLDGHTIEELSDYLDRGKEPADPSVDESAACRIALASLERLHGAMGSMVQEEADRAPARDDSWVTTILDGIVRDSRSGRDIPISHPAPTARLSVTEGAVRGLLRAAGDSVDNIIVGRCRLDGDVTTPGVPVTVTVDANVYRGENIPTLADNLRSALLDALHSHTELTIAGIDVTIRDIFLIKPEPEGGVQNHD
ncbi:MULTISPECIES: hypothetical protein [Cryobacterium]|uniref:Asp23/Gls24 family envelope stress response protein n=1 Tax=Cryobacterium breve TaxID=1259258 RepID=A0ABY2J155_9MICO|nr:MULTISPECIES: hypothetical protein [Cryobacterium]TFC94107.1 hypothetical protein E3T20_09060 [Cryobacterium sp. TmT3-12]TFC98662.1 hypothetical protein E3O65_07230 [Cryobacterium breve]